MTRNADAYTTLVDYQTGLQQVVYLRTLQSGKKCLLIKLTHNSTYAYQHRNKRPPNSTGKFWSASHVPGGHPHTGFA